MGVKTLDGDQMHDLINWLADREEDIQLGMEDFYELREIFRQLFGREAGEPDKDEHSPW